MLAAHGSFVDHGSGIPAITAWLPSLVVGVTLLMAYLGLVARRGRVLGRRWSGRRVAGWVTGCTLVAVALSPGIAELAHADARGHMVQHLLLGMYAPLGLVLAAPVTLLLGAASPTGRRRLATLLAGRPVRVLTHPAVAGVIDVGGLYVLYLTGLYAASTTSTPLHLAVNLHLLLAGCLFTWAIAGPDPVRHRPGLPTRVVALVLAAAAHAVLAKTLYAQAAALPPGSPHPAAEVEAAAQWMYYGGDVAEVALAAALFTTWYRTRRQ